MVGRMLYVCVCRLQYTVIRVPCMTADLAEQEQLMTLCHRQYSHSDCDFFVYSCQPVPHLCNTSPRSS